MTMEMAGAAPVRQRLQRDGSGCVGDVSVADCKDSRGVQVQLAVGMQTLLFPDAAVARTYQLAVLNAARMQRQ